MLSFFPPGAGRNEVGFVSRTERTVDLDGLDQQLPQGLIIKMDVVSNCVVFMSSARFCLVANYYVGARK